MVELEDGEHNLSVWYDESIGKYRISSTPGGVVLSNSDLATFRDELNQMLNEHGGRNAI